MDRWDSWMNRSINETNEIRNIMNVAEPASGLLAVPVGKAVNKVVNNGAGLTAPISLGEPETLF
jgi:putative SOS response-associated peptidase YedK